MFIGEADKMGKPALVACGVRFTSSNWPHTDSGGHTGTTGVDITFSRCLS